MLSLERSDDHDWDVCICLEELLDELVLYMLWCFCFAKDDRMASDIDTQEVSV